MVFLHQAATFSSSTSSQPSSCRISLWSSVQCCWNWCCLWLSEMKLGKYQWPVTRIQTQEVPSPSPASLVIPSNWSVMCSKQMLMLLFWVPSSYIRASLKRNETNTVLQWWKLLSNHESFCRIKQKYYYYPQVVTKGLEVKSFEAECSALPLRPVSSTSLLPVAALKMHCHPTSPELSTGKPILKHTVLYHGNA